MVWGDNEQKDGIELIYSAYKSWATQWQLSHTNFKQ